MIKNINEDLEPSVSPVMNEDSLIALIVDSIHDIKGKNIIKMNLAKLDDAPAEAFIICEGESITQIRAISDNIHRRVKNELGMTPNHIEGNVDARWILVDYFTTVVHIFYPDSRSYYDLEGLWNDAHVIEIPDFEPWDITSS